MLGYFFQVFIFLFFEKNTHACSSDMRVNLPYTDKNVMIVRYKVTESLIFIIVKVHLGVPQYEFFLFEYSMF